MTLNERLKKIRIELDLNQQQLADKLGVTQAAISATEKGKNNLTSEALFCLLKEYNINLNWLIAGIGEMFLPAQEKPSFADRLNSFQAEKGITDFELTKQTGIKESRLEDLGLGKAKPTIEELQSLKKVSGKSIDWWLGDED